VLKRKLGKTGLDITPLVFGCASFGWNVDQKTAFDLLDAFVAEGFDCIDTADAYSVWVPGHKGGESETIIGHWLKSTRRRDKLVIATKVGWEISSECKGLSKRHVLRAVDGSLTRLQTEYIDLYQSHIDDPNTPLEETLSAYAMLIQQGKIRAVGASNYTAPRLSEALETSARCGLPRYQTLQPRYNLCDREVFETTLAPLCQKESIGVLAYAALGGGFLTGKYRSEVDLAKGVRHRSVSHHFTPRGFKILHAVDEVAQRRGFAPAQVALAWVLSRPNVIAPVVSATNLSQLADVLKGTRIALDLEALTLLDAVSQDSVNVARA
jgi:aryl-alcohol dehydrogenase-like predicted oxidoreductase